MAVFWKLGPLIGIENDFNHTAAIEFMTEWRSSTFVISTIYVISIFTLQQIMKNRQKYNLRGPLMTWNLFLALFSMLGFVINSLFQWQYALLYGWKRSVCDLIMLKGQEGIFSFLFCFSKLPELLDTYFVVLRKQKLIFLHWYHHVTVFIYCWYSYSSITSPQQWFITLNYFIHFIMYSYYTVRASGVCRPPIWINMIITSLQIFQMVVGVVINVYVLGNMVVDQKWYCDGKIETTYSYVLFALAMYASYFALFAQYFFKAYIHRRHSKLRKTIVSAEKSGTCDSTKSGCNSEGKTTGSH